MLHLVGKTWRRWLAVGDKSSELSVAERGLSLLTSKKKKKLFLLTLQKIGSTKRARETVQYSIWNPFKGYLCSRKDNALTQKQSVNHLGAFMSA